MQFSQSAPLGTCGPRGARTGDGRQEETQLSIGGSRRVRERDCEGSTFNRCWISRLMRHLHFFLPAKGIRAPSNSFSIWLFLLINSPSVVWQTMKIDPSAHRTPPSFFFISTTGYSAKANFYSCSSSSSLSHCFSTLSRILEPSCILSIYIRV